jgi:hypothetical protein
MWQRVGRYSSPRGVAGKPPAHADGAMALDGSVTPGALCAWLQALAAYTAMPPVRPFNVCTHHYPMALPMFWRLVETLAQRVPPHWLSSAISPLLGSGALERTAAVARATRCSSIEPLALPPQGAWPAATGAADDWDFGVAAAESDALAAAWAACLPRALLAPGLAAAKGAGVGGALVLYELALRDRQPPDFCGSDEVAQSHKLVVVLVHPDLATGHGPRGSAVSQIPRIVGVRDLVTWRGAPSWGGARIQILSGARWAADDTVGETRGEWGQPTYGPHRLRFWIREARLQEMIKEYGRNPWYAHAVLSDT